MRCQKGTISTLGYISSTEKDIRARMSFLERVGELSLEREYSWRVQKSNPGEHPTTSRTSGSPPCRRTILHFGSEAWTLGLTAATLSYSHGAQCLMEGYGQKKVFCGDLPSLSVNIKRRRFRLAIH